jgi:hypothetical protein
VVQAHDLAIAPGGAGGRAFDHELIAELRSRDRHRFLRMLM